MSKKTGGPAFARPYAETSIGGNYEQDGMSLRAYVMTHAPISFADVVKCYGAEPNLNDDAERRGFFALWALLRSEYADAMIEQIVEDESPENRDEPPY